MKTLLLSFCLLLGFYVAKSQNDVTLPIDSTTKTVAFISIENIDSVSKDELFSRALSWFGKSYNSAKKVIQTEDRLGGVIIAKPLFSMYSVGVFGEEMQLGNVVNYTLSVYVKDNKYRVIVSDFIYKSSTQSWIVPASGNTQNFSFSIKYWNKVRTECIKEAEKVRISLNKAMTIPKVKNDW